MDGVGACGCGGVVGADGLVAEVKVGSGDKVGVACAVSLLFVVDELAVAAQHFAVDDELALDFAAQWVLVALFDIQGFARDVVDKAAVVLPFGGVVDAREVAVGVVAVDAGLAAVAGQRAR